MLLLWASLGILSLPSLALDFTLRHIHHAHGDTGHILWANVDVAVASGGNVYTLATQSFTIQKPVLLDQWVHVPRTFRTVQNWKSHEVIGPATNKRETLLALAKMTNNAYFKDSETIGWYDLGGKWTNDHSIGYDPSTSGFRGHVFVSHDNRTAVLSIKGTSAVVFGGSATVFKDKLNDNLLFSCCCARVDWTWIPVCGCARSGGRCDQSCVESSLQTDGLFYGIGVNLYNNLTYMYPNAQIWVVGHSLGGSLASLVGATFGAPVVAFEAPGERLAAQRLHLPIAEDALHITHVYNTADPIPMGACTGPTSVCYQGKYAMETRCHLGQTIVYDTLSILHWASDIRSHFINTIIDQLLDEDWSTKVKKSKKSRFPWPWSEELGDEEVVEVPKPTREIDCAECFNWEYGDFPE
ncbi:unnamed protein product [Rhizoctonia solani]|uniref:triacylglycerol lipase n=1 Tax=Rhizoctonia solani TaxID=456999 RepID=A0A8H3H9L5_9AGAM|nr:unnamed protein product [Rhizoctonia solani]